MDVFGETEIAGSLGGTARDHPFIRDPIRRLSVVFEKAAEK